VQQWENIIIYHPLGTLSNENRRTGYSIKRKRYGRIVSQWGCVGRQGTLAGLKVIVHRVVNSIGFSDVATKDLESDKKLEKKAQVCLWGKYNEANEGEPKLKATA